MYSDVFFSESVTVMFLILNRRFYQKAIKIVASDKLLTATYTNNLIVKN